MSDIARRFQIATEPKRPYYDRAAAARRRAAWLAADRAKLEQAFVFGTAIILRPSDETMAIISKKAQ